MRGKFHALLVVRDEVDIIEKSLHHLASWADAVYVFDTGSVDGTWDVVQRVANKNQTVKPVDRKPVYFSLPKVRSYLFHHARKHMHDGDWFLRVDADERYHINPREFVDRSMTRGETVAWRQYYDFRLTEDDVNRWNEQREAEQSRPIEDRLRYFTIKRRSEPRLCKYRPTMTWPSYASFPKNAGIVARARIPIRHYPHRNPVQMAKRYALRSIQVRDEESKTGKSLEHHWAREDWARDIVETDCEDLYYWMPEAGLPEVEQDHGSPPHIRLIKRFLYRLPSSVIDWWNESYDERDTPDPLPEHIQERVRAAYDEIHASFGITTLLGG